MCTARFCAVASAAPRRVFACHDSPTASSRQSTPSVASAHDKILIVDFGSQVTQLIARRVREEGVYSEIVPFQKAEAAFAEMKPKAVILSGGPASVHEAGSPARAAGDLRFRRAGARHLLRPDDHGRAARRQGRGRPSPRIRPRRCRGQGRRARCSMASGTMGEKHPVWMSHGDRVTKLPPGFAVAGVVAERAVRGDRRTRRANTTALMFHPEVVHTPDGAKLIRNFVRKVAGLTGDWTMRAFREEAIEKIRAQVGKGRVICGLSGGVDSAVAAVLIHEAIGDQLTCVFVDHGMLRLDEAKTVVDLFRAPLQHPAGARGCVEAIPRRARRRHRPRSEAQDHRPAVHRRVRCGSQEDRRRGFPRAGHALSRRDRERLLHRRPVGDDQVAPQCRRPARAHEHEAGRAAARTVQGRGARARPRTRPARNLRRPPSVPGPGPRDPLPRRDHARKSSTSCATPTRSISTRSARPASTTRSGRPSRCCCR